MLERDIEMVLASKGIKKSTIADKIGESKQNIGAKFKRGTLKEEDIKNLLNAAGISAEIIYTDRDTGKKLFSREI